MSRTRSTVKMRQKAATNLPQCADFLTSRIYPHLLPSPEGFSHGQALPLPFGTFLSPRIGRGWDAECPRKSPARQPWSCPAQDHALCVNSPSPFPGHVRSQPVIRLRPGEPQRRRQSVHVHKPSVSSRHPRRVRTWLRVNRPSIVWLAARRQGMTPPLPCEFHLDDARFAGRQACD